tara:strand:+ start:1263 stop:2120 length:858 start_codon:yes stop_codon:yes gene_type:complete
MSFINLDSCSFHYHHYKGDGPDLVLLHGLASNLNIWNLVAPILAQEFNVYSLDQRGHGLSFKPDKGYDFESITKDLIHFCKNLDLTTPIIVGHSWGANVVIESLAHDMDNYFGGGVLLDGGVLNVQKTNRSSWSDIETRLAPPVLTHLTLDQLLQRVRESRKDDWNEAFEDVLTNSFEVVNGLIAPRLSRENHMKILYEIWNENILFSLESINTPVLILPVSSDDKESNSPNMHGVSKKEAVDIAISKLRNSKVEWLKNSIHDVPIQNPNLVINAILESKDTLFS